MKARLRRQLRCFKGQIERRLERENNRGTHDGRPVLRGTGATYEVASRVRAVAATQVVSTGRQLKLRLLVWNPWQHVFFRALDAVRLIS